MFWNKEKPPFKEGQLVSNGKRVIFVNAVFKNKEGRWKMLIDEHFWSITEHKATECEEVFCDDWYLVK